MNVGDAVEILDRPHLDYGDPVLVPNGQRGTVVEVAGDVALVDLGESTRGYFAVDHLRVAS
jgi:hypothetical protein